MVQRTGYAESRRNNSTLMHDMGRKEQINIRKRTKPNLFNRLNEWFLSKWYFAFPLWLIFITYNLLSFYLLYNEVNEKFLNDETNVCFFDADSKKFNILILNFEEFPSDKNKKSDIGRLIQKEFEKRIEEENLNIEVCIDNPTFKIRNFAEADSLCRERNANLVLYGDYFTDSTYVKLKYVHSIKEPIVFFGKNEPLLSERDPEISYVFEANESNLIKVDLKTISEGELLNDPLCVVYWVLSLQSFEEKQFKRTLQILNKIPKTNFIPIFLNRLRLNCFTALGEWDNCLKTVDKLIELDSTNSEYFCDRGVFLKKLNKKDEAFKAYEKSINLNSNYTIVYYNRGILYLTEKNFEKAFADFDKAINLDSLYFQALVKRAECYLNLNILDKCKQDLDKVLRINPNSDDAFSLLGILFKRQLNNELAIEYFNKAIKMNPKNHLIYFNRALSFWEINKWNEAINDMKIVIKWDKKFVIAYVIIIYSYYNLNDFANAFEYTAIALSNNIEHYEIYNARGFLYNETKKFGEAIKEFNRAIKLNPNFELAYINRGYAFSNQKYFEDAFKDYEIAEKINPANSYLYFYRGLTYINMNKFNLARKDLEKALLLDKRGNLKEKIQQNITLIEKLN